MHGHKHTQTLVTCTRKWSGSWQVSRLSSSMGRYGMQTFITWSKKCNKSRSGVLYLHAGLLLNMPHCHASTASHSHCSISLYAFLHAIITQLTAPDLPWCSNSLAWALRPAFLMACSNTSHVAPSLSRQEQRMRKKASLTSCLWLSTSMSTVVVVMFRYVHNALH